MKVANVLNCSFSYWYPQFRRETIESRIISLSREFIDYLLQDGIVLPPGTYAEPKYDCNSDEDEAGHDWEQAESEECKAPSFPEIEERIKGYIEDLGGSVFPKLNWSCPKDAKWISADHTLQCVTVGEVLLLLKSSDFITHDLTEPFKNCVDWECDKGDSKVVTPVAYELVLRKWTDVNPGTEFRCFVKGGSLIAICQRDYTNFYEYILNDKTQLVMEITNFFKDRVNGNFPDLDYCFDVFFPTKNSIMILDFNPFGETTDALLFDWEYLFNRHPRDTQEPEFRCITSYDGVHPCPYRYYAMPVDVLHLTGLDAYKMTDFLQLMENGSLDVDKNDEEKEAEK